MRPIVHLLFTGAVFWLGACACKQPAQSPAQWQSSPYAYASTTPEAAPSAEAAPAAEATPSASPRFEFEEEAALHQRFAEAPALDVYHGKAAYYGDSLAGNRTASGERYDPRAFTAAHRTLPFNTIVRVVRPDNGRVTYVRITDRGPFGDSRRIIDVAKIAAERLDMLDAGVVDVRVEVVRRGP